MDFDKMVDYIVQEVLKRLEEQETPTKKEKNRGLVIINGGNGNLEQVMLELKKISKEYDLEVVFSEAGKSVVGEKDFQILRLYQTLLLKIVESFYKIMI